MHYAHCEVCTEYKLRSLNLCFLTQTQREGVETIIYKLFSLPVKINTGSNICVECDGFLTECYKFYDKIQNALHNLSQKALSIADPLNIKNEDAIKIEFDEKFNYTDNGKHSTKVHAKRLLPKRNASLKAEQSSSKKRKSRKCAIQNAYNDAVHDVKLEAIDIIFDEKPQLLNADGIILHSGNHEDLSNGFDDMRSFSPAFFDDEFETKDSNAEKFGVIDDSFPKEIIRDGILLVSGKKMNDLLSKFYNLSCELCMDLPRFKSLFLLQEHYQLQHKMKGYVRCCETKLNDRKIIKYHMAKHVQPTAFDCHICKRSFTRPLVLRDHLLTHLPEADKPFKCEICDKRFSKKFLIKIHMANHVPDEQKDLFKCEQCGKGFPSKQRMRHHQLNFHNTTNKFICAVCGKVFTAKANYKYHIGTHEKKDDRVKVPCPECGDLFSSETTLKKHLILHGPKNICCDLCDCKLYTNFQLKVHKKMKHSDIKQHKCTFCAKMFKTKPNLVNHMAQHTGEAKFSCLFCPRKFVQNGNKYTHMSRMHPEYKKKKSFARGGYKSVEEKI